eukprot:582177-Prorocentrum_minimum.AAC.3
MATCFTLGNSTCKNISHAYIEYFDFPKQALACAREACPLVMKGNWLGHPGPKAHSRCRQTWLRQAGTSKAYRTLWCPLPAPESPTRAHSKCSIRLFLTFPCTVDYTERVG